MWSRKKKDDDDGSVHDNGSSATERPASSRLSEDMPTERTRLLQQRPPPPRADGYLDPDDPAVSPYNLWTVRLLRYVTVLFTMITFIWWVLLLVSIFVTPPGFNTRGSGYTDFAYTCLTMGNLLVALIFFAGPSQALRVTISVIAILLLVDLIIIVAVGKLRMEESWPGIASIVWAEIIAIWCVLTDRVVAYGKQEEEERLTGRPETRRTLREWLGVFVSTFITVVFIIIAVLMTATLILRSVDAGLPPPGQRYDVDSGKYAIHVDCVGEIKRHDGKKEPTILIEAGELPSEGSGLEHWAYSAYQNGTIPRYCYWDRPGYAWSDNAPSPHSAGMSADSLSEALAIMGETGPWVSISSGYGSLVARIFASRHYDAVTGLMLVDPLHEDLLHRIGQPGQGFITWGYGIVSPLGIQRLAGALFKGRSKEDRVYGISIWQSGRFLKAKLQENLVAESFTKREASTARTVQTPNTPLVVISSGISGGRDQEWADKQKDLTKLTKNLVAFETVQGAPHEVWKTSHGATTMERKLAALLEEARKI